MVTGNFSFCTPPGHEQRSSCGPDDGVLGSATFSGIGTDTIDLNCTVSGSCAIYADYLEPYSATADLNVVAEPSTLVLLLSSLLAYPALLFLRRRRLAVVRTN